MNREEIAARLAAIVPTQEQEELYAIAGSLLAQADALAAALHEAILLANVEDEDGNVISWRQIEPWKRILYAYRGEPKGEGT